MFRSGIHYTYLFPLTSVLRYFNSNSTFFFVFMSITGFLFFLFQSCTLHLKSDNGPIEVYLSESAIGESPAKEQSSRLSPLKASTSAANTSRTKLRPTRTKANKALLQTRKPVLKTPKKVTLECLGIKFMDKN